MISLSVNLEEPAAIRNICHHFFFFRKNKRAELDYVILPATRFLWNGKHDSNFYQVPVPKLFLSLRNLFQSKFYTQIHKSQINDNSTQPAQAQTKNQLFFLASPLFTTIFFSFKLKHRIINWLYYFPFFSHDKKKIDNIECILDEFAVLGILIKFNANPTKRQNDKIQNDIKKTHK